MTSLREKLVKQWRDTDYNRKETLQEKKRQKEKQNSGRDGEGRFRSVG